MAHTKKTIAGNVNNGTANTFSYSGSFDVFKASEVEVELDNVALTFTTGTINESASPREYTVDFTNKTVHIGGADLTSTDQVVIQPVTDMGSPTPRATYTAGASVTSADLNNNQLQLLRKAMEYDEQKLSSRGGTMTGNLHMGEDVDISFEGDTDNAYETTLTVADPTADRTITLPNVTGTVVTTGDTGTVATGMIAGDAITGAKIADDQINSEHYVDGSIDTAHYAAGSVDATALGNDSVITAKIQNGAVTTAKIVANAVVTDSINADAVTGAKIADDSINSEHYVDGSIDTAHIADDQITTAKVAAGNITATELATDSVTGAKIAAGAINNANKIQDSIVTGAKIGSGTIAAGNLATNSVTTAKIADDAITAAKLNANSVVNAALDTVAQNRIKGRVSSGTGNVEDLTAAQVRTMINVENGATAGGGITMAQQWRQHTNTSNPSSITQNWEVNDNGIYGGIGSNMTEAAGVFTFPSTGIYYIAVDQTFHVTSNGEDRRCEIHIQTTTNNSSYEDIAIGYTNLGVGSSTTFGTASCATFVDITDVSNRKVRFTASVNNSNTQLTGNSGYNENSYVFIRLGDT